MAFRNCKDSIAQAIATIDNIHRGVPYVPPPDDGASVPVVMSPVRPSGAAVVADPTSPSPGDSNGTELTFKTF